MLPGPARGFVFVEHDVANAAAFEVVRRGEAGLAGTDHNRVVEIHTRETPGLARLVLRCLAVSAISATAPKVCSRSTAVASSAVTLITTNAPVKIAEDSSGPYDELQGLLYRTMGLRRSMRTTSRQRP